MADALIGYTGFVGTTLVRQRGFDEFFRSTDIGTIAGKRFDTVFCAGASAQKWLANREPDLDRASIDSLVRALSTVRCRRFVLISTVDVFAAPIGVDEGSLPSEDNLHPYGRHRLLLETFVRTQFPDSVIVRLPGLVGPGLRKNIIYDLHHDNHWQGLDPLAQYQFYPMVNLWADLRQVLALGLPVVHLTAEPLSTGEVAEEVFAKVLRSPPTTQAPRYDFRSRYASHWGCGGAYQYSKRESLLAIRAYAQSEPRTADPGARV